MTRYSTESRTKNYVKGYGILSFARHFSNKYGKKIIRYTNRCFKNCLQKGR